MMRFHPSQNNHSYSFVLMVVTFLLVICLIPFTGADYEEAQTEFHLHSPGTWDPVTTFNETSDESDDTIGPMVVSGIIILVLVIIVSYFTLKEQERQKKERKKARREKRRQERKLKRERLRKEQLEITVKNAEDSTGKEKSSENAAASDLRENDKNSQEDMVREAPFENHLDTGGVHSKK